MSEAKRPGEDEAKRMYELFTIPGGLPADDLYADESNLTNAERHRRILIQGIATLTTPFYRALGIKALQLSSALPERHPSVLDKLARGNQVTDHHRQSWEYDVNGWDYQFVFDYDAVYQKGQPHPSQSLPRRLQTFLNCPPNPNVEYTASIPVARLEIGINGNALSRVTLTEVWPTAQLDSFFRKNPFASANTLEAADLLLDELHDPNRSYVQTLLEATDLRLRFDLSGKPEFVMKGYCVYEGETSYGTSYESIVHSEKKYAYSPEIDMFRRYDIQGVSTDQLSSEHYLRLLSRVLGLLPRQDIKEPQST